MKFTKMHGIGNDYVYIDCLEAYPVPEEEISQLAVKLSDRHTGVGGDGIVLICPSQAADFKMRIFNADGSEAKMCGNGIRCVGKWLHDHGKTNKEKLTIQTLSGIKALDMHLGKDGKVDEVTVDMGVPSLQARDSGVDSDGEIVDRLVSTPHEEDVKLTVVSMGNPHGVVFVKDLASIPFEMLGPALENHPMWKDRANIEFAEKNGDTRFKVRVWERGSGETLACGTGACAVATAARRLGLAGNEVTIELKGGKLAIRTDAETGRVYMTGSATEVFEGVIED